MESDAADEWLPSDVDLCQEIRERADARNLEIHGPSSLKLNSPTKTPVSPFKI